MSDTVKIILIVAFFAFLIYRKKVSAFLAGSKGKRHGKAKQDKNAVSAVSVQPENIQDASVLVSGKTDVPYRYEVYAFDFSEHLATEHFADKITARLDMIEISMLHKKHFIKFVELGTLLLIVVKYRD